MNSERAEQLKTIEMAVGHEFADIRLLDTALTHKSFVKGENNKGQYNERLEFLGDAVLELCVSEYLFANYPGMDEGAMTRLRAQVVNGRALYEIGRAMDLGSFLLMSRGEERGGGREKPSMLANCLEALIGAVYADGGRADAERFILEKSTAHITELALHSGEKDYKTMLQEFVQKRHIGAIEYNVVGERGPDHERVFVMTVSVGGEPCGTGEGRSKQEAGQSAAEAAMKALV